MASASSALSILVPVRHRPHRVAPLLASIYAATPEAEVLFICDPDDAAEVVSVDAACAVWEWADWLIHEGNYAQKINRAIAVSNVLPRPFVFLGADDLHFHPGWLEAALLRMTDEIEVVGTNDLCNPRVIAGFHSTHSLVRRRYCRQGTIDEPGKLLHEGYEHEYVDDEFTQTAQARGVWIHAADSIVEHLHPDVGKAPEDALYRARRGRMVRGRRIYRKRRVKWRTLLS